MNDLVRFHPQGPLTGPPGKLTMAPATSRPLARSSTGGCPLTISPDVDRIVPHPDVVFREVEGEVVLLNTVTGQYFSLDAVGSRIWALLGTTGTSRAALETALLDEFDVTETQLRGDLDALLKELSAHALILSQ